MFPTVLTMMANTETFNSSDGFMHSVFGGLRPQHSTAIRVVHLDGISQVRYRHDFAKRFLRRDWDNEIIMARLIIPLGKARELCSAASCSRDHTRVTRLQGVPR